MHAQLKKLSDCRVLVAGDLMLDRYWFGDVERISPEAPVPIVTVGDTDERIGGAGNVAANIAALGGQCTLLAVVGDDDAGVRVLEIAQRKTNGTVTPNLIVDRNAKTTVKLRVLSRNQQLLRADFESPPPATALDEFAARFAAVLDDHQAVVLSDYGKGALARVQSLIKLAAQKNIPVLVDPKGGDFAKYSGATMVTPNLTEFEQAAGAVKDDADIAAKAKQLMTQHSIKKLLVTLSERGMLLLSLTKPPMHRTARARQVYDVSGAGDSVIAVMAMAAAARLEDDTALKFANSTAGVVVSKLGAATADLDELQTALARDYRE